MTQAPRRPAPSLRRRQLLAGLAATVPWAAGVRAQALAWPQRPVTIVVSFPPGGDTDALARLFAEKLAARIGQQVVVDNRTGASGTIGNAHVAKQPADGHTLLFTPNTFSIAPLVLRNGTGAAYDVANDFTPIIQMGSQSLFVVVNSATGLTSLKELVAAAKAGKLETYATPGNGSPMHILGEAFNRAAGTAIKPVPYRGSGPAIVDLVGGQLPMMYTTLGPVAQHIASGKLRNLGVADPKRSPLAPAVPTLAEAGWPDVLVGAWQGFMAPKGLPPALVQTLNGHFNEILKMPDVQQRMTALAMVPVGGDAASFGKLAVGDHQRYARIVKELNIQAD